MEIMAELDGLVFTTSGNGTYSILPPDGWFSSPAVKTFLTERPASDGAFGEIEFNRSARVITLVGDVLSSPGELSNDCLRLAGLLAQGEPKMLTVNDGSLVLSSLVRPFGGGATVTPIDDRNAEFILSLVAVDPIKYGPVRSLATGLPVEGGGLEYELGEPAAALFYGTGGDLGRVSLTNAGTATTFPMFTVTGGMADGFFIQRLDTGQVVRYDRVVSLGSTVTVNMRTGAVVVDGTSDGSTYLSRAEFFGVEAGASFDVQFNALGAATGTPTMTVDVQDGYW